MADDIRVSDLDEDELEINLRPATEVGRRLLVLATLIEHLTLEDAGAADADEQAARLFDLREWLRAEEIWPAMTQDEVLLVAGPAPLPADDDPFSLQETIEAFAALAWCLHLAEQLEAGVPANVDAIIETLPHPWEATAAWLGRLQLRSLDDVAAQREAAELWTWRLLTEADLYAASAAERDELREVIRATEREGRSAGLLPRGGFLVQGRNISTLNVSERNSLLAAMLARLKTLNWVCGYGERWDDVPLDI